MLWACRMALQLLPGMPNRLTVLPGDVLRQLDQGLVGDVVGLSSE